MSRHEELSIGVLTSDTILLQGDTLQSSGVVAAGIKYYVSRNKGSTGDGSSWDKAFLTITEAVTAVNTGYTNGSYNSNRGRNTVIYIDEGWYAELPISLTASDCTIIAVSPGHHDSTVLYGVPVAGVFSGTAAGPALEVRGSNNSVIALGVYTSDPLYPAVRNGANAGNPDSPTAIAPTGNKFSRISIIRDVADGELGGLQDYGGDGTLIEKGFFSTSCKDYGVSVLTNGVVNPVNCIVRDCDFVGTPVGIVVGATAHNTLIRNNMFRDDSSDRADTITTPVTNAGDATSTVCIENHWAFSDANAVTGNQAMMINNFQLATT